MGQEVFLEVKSITKSYNYFVAVDGVSFTVKKGEVFGLLGPNGAGKTTTIKMLCGLLKADSGAVLFHDSSLSSSYHTIKSLIGLCPQEIVVWELLTCMEQLKFVGISYGLSAKNASEKADYLLKSLGLADKRNKLAKTLSGGMQRRLNMALALVHDPEIIILDEPQAGLDPQSRILVRDFIRGLAKNKTVILTTHDMDEAQRLSDRIAIMDHGKVLVIDTPDKLIERSGMGDLLQIRIEKTDEQLIQKLILALPKELTEKRYTDETFYLGAKDLPELIPVIKKLLNNFGVKPIDMTIRKRTLEDAFISMTGRGLRE